MTRSHKVNDQDHSGSQEGAALLQEHLPRFFAKSGPVDADPRKTKKDGGGKRNWSVQYSSSLAPIRSTPSDLSAGAALATKSMTMAINSRIHDATRIAVLRE
ncbi:uncharacterized protein BO80DRAFT_77819 [Aspergillus ibericus CBS 121593]|uniref:Uncharacterized protein n=1 Tax=Aspergillus ibericus CBS 121593 TaxID=1448316 RepID=A0A395HEY0_9EURO|nr:hypothetical protein BO80DRAFT_77819 [Aspergillus ibericus CBS 121593]RAL05675.1 hypothetical protein BO80DRAFT_77819 [Aspergillus ibericus CBS 121593]